MNKKGFLLIEGFGTSHKAFGAVIYGRRDTRYNGSQHNNRGGYPTEYVTLSITTRNAEMGCFKIQFQMVTNNFKQTFSY